MNESFGIRHRLLRSFETPEIHYPWLAGQLGQLAALG